MPVQRINPPELFDSKPVGFSQMVVVEGETPSVHLSGQVAWNAEREIVGKGDLNKQVVQSLRNIETALGYAKASLKNVVALRIYIRQDVIHDTGAVTRGLLEVFDDALPCATWIGVPCLAREEFLVEIEPTIDMSIDAR